MKRRFIHVFAGIDALSVAKPDWKPIAFSEIEPFACAVLAHHRPNVPNLGDITKADFTQFQGEADIYAGGSPCQAFSIAGLRKSLQDTRGNLTLEYIRGFNESKCPIGLWENVPGVLTTDDNAFGLFVAGMVGEPSMLFPDDKQAEQWLEAEFSHTLLRFNLALVDFRFFRVYRGRRPKIKWGNAGMVFGPKGSFAWRVLDAQYFSLPQRRERVFGVAFRPGNAHRLLGAAPGEDLCRFLGLPGAVLFEPGCVPGHIAASGKTRQKAASVTERGSGRKIGNQLRKASGGVGGSQCCNDGKAGTERFGRNTGGTTTVLGGGNLNPLSVAPSCLSHGYRLDLDSEAFVACIKGAAIGRQPQNGPQHGEIREDGISYTLNASEVHAVCFQQNSCHELRSINGDGQLTGAVTASPGMTQQNYLAFSYKDYGDDVGILSPTLRSGGFKNSHANSGAPPAVVIKIDHTSSNGWGVLTDGTSHTLGGSTDAVAYFSLQNTTPKELFDMRGSCGSKRIMRETLHATKIRETQSKQFILRRFSVTECLRLQGFPDGYLDITYRGKPAFNGPKYRAIGNSWAVTVARWVGDRLDYVLDAIENELAKKHGIRQQNDAAGKEYQGTGQSTPPGNTDLLTTTKNGNNSGTSSTRLRERIEAEKAASVRRIPATARDRGTDSVGRQRSLETQELIKKERKTMITTPVEIISKEADEQYTPNTKEQPVVDLVIQVLGAIGVDVTADALHAIPAAHHITQKDNYLTANVAGMGTAFMNPPYSCPLPFVQKLCTDFANGHLTEAIALLKAGTAHNQGTGQLIKQHATAQCQWGVHVGRIGFIKEGIQRKGADFDCTLYYFGPNWQKFKEVFDPYGLVSLLPKAQTQLVSINNFLEKRQAQPNDKLTTKSCQLEADLTYDEERDRLHLERQVESAFHIAGKALMELRDRRLYRNTHPSWEAYCQEHFGFSHQNGDKKIAAARVVEVLTTNSCQILPSCVEQAYPLSKLKDEEQIVEIWEDLTQEGKRPSGKKVQSVVAEICDRQAERGEYHNPWKVGDICQIFKKGDGTLAKYDGVWAIVSEVKTRQCVVKVWNGEVLVKAENLEELQVGEEFREVCDRIRSLMIRHIDGTITLKRGQLRFLEALGEQSTAFEPEDIEILACIDAKANNHDTSLVQATRLLVENVEYLTDDEARSLFDAIKSTHGF